MTPVPPDRPPVPTGLVRRRAARLAAGPPCRRQDREDAEQDLACRLLAAAYLPARGHPLAFAAVVLDRAAADLARRRNARKRAPVASLSADPPAPCRLAAAELRLDVAAVLARLGGGLGDLADRLREQPLAAAARDLGVPRSTLQRRVARLRLAFAAAGLAPAGYAPRPSRRTPSGSPAAIPQGGRS